MLRSPKQTITLTSHSDAEVFVVRGDLSLVKRGVGTITTEPLSPGIYKLKVVRGGRGAERLVQVPGDERAYELLVDPIRTIAPSVTEYGAGGGPGAVEIDQFVHSLAFANFADVAQPPPGASESAAVDVDETAELVVAFTADKALESWFPTLWVGAYSAADEPPDESANLVDAARTGQLPLAGNELRAVRASLPPETYRLRVDAEGKSLQIAVPLLPGWQTRVFGSRRLSPDESPQGASAELAVQMRRPDVSFVGGPTDDYPEVVRIALARGRRIIASKENVAELQRAMTRDPLVGVAGLHLMLDAIERESRRGTAEGPLHLALGCTAEDVAETLKALRGTELLGPYADLQQRALVLPDIVALHLRANLMGRRRIRVSRPPLFWASWQVLLSAGDHHVELDPDLRMAALTSFAWGPYLGVSRRLKMQTPWVVPSTREEGDRPDNRVQEGRTMGTPRQLDRLRKHNRSVQAGDLALAAETRDRMAVWEMPEAVNSMPADIERQIELESIVMRRERPVLAIRDNVPQLAFGDQADSEIWRERLGKAEVALVKAIRAVGRIDLRGAGLDWVGTGWLVADDVLVTNRHVAREFAEHRDGAFTFAAGASGPIEARTDFLQEIDNPNELLFRLLRPLHIESAPGPDVAFFEIEATSGEVALAGRIELASTIETSQTVATIGYPAYDSRVPEPDLMERIYGRTYNKKRLAPGRVTQFDDTRLWHDCTTLGGNSGSVVFDFAKGVALGLHFSGSFLASNYAVRADVVRRLLDDVRTGRAARRHEAPARPPRLAPPAVPPAPRATTASFTIPLTVTVSINVEQPSLAPGRLSGAFRAGGGDGAELDETESVPEDYGDRPGYDEGFLGAGNGVKLPEVLRDAADVLEFPDRGSTTGILLYDHFSVVMSHRRRMCFFSACNIDGGRSRKSARVGWKWDPRIPRAQQIMKECYGDPPRFSRGHMTRREDPAWGDTLEDARRGSQDSMHVTNATPQMQAFNAPIWLALEDYALDHAREDDMKISVFTGPYFSERDPEMYGVRIPLAFWKIIAFIHDETGVLSATGYEMDQKGSLRPEEEFVFGAFTSPQLSIATQVPIRTIEARSGLRFDRLSTFDPLAGEEESVSGAGPAPLLTFEQIRFA